MIQGLKKTPYITYHQFIIAKTVWNAALEFLCYRIDRKMGVIILW